MGNSNSKSTLHFQSFAEHWKEPYEELAFSQIAIEVVGGLRPTIPPSCSKELETLITACWNQDPEVRPSFDEIVERLESLSWEDAGSGKLEIRRSMKKEDSIPSNSYVVN